MKKVVVLTAFLAATYAPAAFATAELKLSSGASSVDILDGSAGDSNPLAGVVTFIGAVGNWTVNVSTGVNGSTPLLDLSSADFTAGHPQVNPIVISFSDDGLFGTPPSSIDFAAGGTVNTAGAPTVTFQAFTGTSKFDTSDQVGSTLTFHTAGYSGSTSSAFVSGDTSATIVATIDLGSATAFGSGSFDSSLETVGGATPEPASISMLGGVLLILGGALRRKIKKA